MSPAVKRGPPTAALSRRNWRSTPPSRPWADCGPSLLDVCSNILTLSLSKGEQDFVPASRRVWAREGFGARFRAVRGSHRAWARDAAPFVALAGPLDLLVSRAMA